MDKKTKDFVKKALPALTDLKAPEGLSLEEQKKMFRTMCLIREFDTQVRTLWMKNEIYGLAHSYVGAEAIAVLSLIHISAGKGESNGFYRKNGNRHGRRERNRQGLC